MPPFGPIYCETPELITSFPAEAINSYSNVVIIAAACAAFFLVYSRAPRLVHAYVLSCVLFLNGVGSFLWHALRREWALTADVVPGMIFLLFYTYLWARAVLGRGRALMFVCGLVGAQFVAIEFFAQRGFTSALLVLVITLLISGLWLAYTTVSMNPFVGKVAVLTLLLGVAAAGMRIADPFVCSVVPIGTHFLWHVLLAAAAFLCVYIVVDLSRQHSRTYPS